MSAYMNGPWRCGSGDCMGRREDCSAPRRNEVERIWLEQREVDNVWLRHYGLPELTIRDARSTRR